MHSHPIATALTKAFLLVALLCPAFRVHAQNAKRDSLQLVIAQVKRDSNEVKALYALADIYSRTDIAKAKQYLYACVDLAKTIQRYRGIASATSALVNLHTESGLTDSAKYYIGQLRKLSEEHPQPEVLSSYYFTAGLFYRRQGNYKASLPFMFKTLEIYTAQGDKLQMSGQMLNIGNNYTDLAQLKKAMEYHLAALKGFEEVGNKRGEAFCLVAISNDFIKLNQFRAALPYAERSLVIKKEIGDRRGEVMTLSTLCQIYSGKGEHIRALAYGWQSVELARQMHLAMDEATSLYNLASAYHSKKDNDSAIQVYKLTRELVLKQGDSSFAARVNNDIASIGLAEEREKSKEDHLVSNLRIAVETGDKFGEIDNYKYLRQLYAARQDYARALAYSDKYYAARDSMSNDETQVRLRQLEQQYNQEKNQRDLAVKEKQIALLKKDSELRHAELEKERTIRIGSFMLAGLLLVIGFLAVNRYRVIQKVRRTVEIEKLRYTIARDLHDDIGSALSSIHINSNMALTHPEDAVVKNQLEKIRQYSGNMMERMGDIVWAINPVNDAVENLLVRMQEFLAEILEPLGIDYRLEAAEAGSLKGRMDVARRKELYLIFKEAVNNAAKYSGCTTVLVSLTADNRNWVLSVADDGRGFDVVTVRRGNGLRNMEERAAALGGLLRIDSAPQKWTTVLLTIPIT